MIKKTLELSTFALCFYILGAMFVLLNVAYGGSGDDLMSQHYKNVIVSVIK